MGDFRDTVGDVPRSPGFLATEISTLSRETGGLVEAWERIVSSGLDVLGARRPGHLRGTRWGGDCINKLRIRKIGHLGIDGAWMMGENEH